MGRDSQLTPVQRRDVLEIIYLADKYDGSRREAAKQMSTKYRLAAPHLLAEANKLPAGLTNDDKCLSLRRFINHKLGLDKAALGVRPQTAYTRHELMVAVVKQVESATGDGKYGVTKAAAAALYGIPIASFKRHRTGYLKYKKENPGGADADYFAGIKTPGRPRYLLKDEETLIAEYVAATSVCAHSKNRKATMALVGRVAKAVGVQDFKGSRQLYKDFLARTEVTTADGAEGRSTPTPGRAANCVLVFQSTIQKAPCGHVAPFGIVRLQSPGGARFVTPRPSQGAVSQSGAPLDHPDAAEAGSLPRRAQLVLRGVPKQELHSIGVSSGWSVVKAQRLFSKDQAKKMKGLWPDQLGISAVVIGCLRQPSSCV
jgi:hypothetical protein